MNGDLAINELQNRHQRFANIGNFNSNRQATATVNLDMATLDLMCKAVVTCNPQFKRSHLINISNLLSQLDPEAYANDQAKMERVKFIRKGLEARLNYNLTSKDMIIMHINGGIMDDGIIKDGFIGLNSSELNWLSDMVSEALKYSEINNSIDNMMAICSKFKNAEYGSKGEAVAEFENAVNNIQNQFRRSRNEKYTEDEFTLEDGKFENVIIDTYNTLAAPGRKLITGMQAMNELLGGGFENGRVYVFMGLPGEGKSTILLNLMYQIKKYNKKVQTKDPTKKPCIVLLTMENLVSESIARLFCMVTGRENMIDYSPEDVIKMMKEEGGLYLTDDSPINIYIKFKPSNSVDTNELYTIADDLEDRGFECICMIQDYIGRIRSTKRNSELRLEYGDIVDEFKIFAETRDISVITAAQLNRDASKHIDEAKEKNRTDLVRTLGRSNVSESINILNNCDAAYVIAPEFSSQDKQFYLGIQKVKGRFRDTTIEYAYLPYGTNGKMKLLEDVNGLPNFKSTLNGGVPFTTTPSSNVYNPTNNIRDNDFNMSFKRDNGDIFSTKPMGEASCAPFNNLNLKTPILFYDARVGLWSI